MGIGACSNVGSLILPANVFSLNKSRFSLNIFPDMM